MDINQAFPSNYLRSCDLQGAQPVVTIRAVMMDDVGDEQKPVVYFEGKDKGVILNKTKSTVMQGAWGPETDNWIGKRIKLVGGMTTYKGEQVACIYFEPQHDAAPQASPAQPASAIADDGNIPF